uniref:UFGT7c n=1 Tax=Actinidia chinensis TaxID=3625 RepID=A0A3B8DZN2_ACTCH|nr:UFGT7c [Actinidia chinensis]
MVAPTFHIAMYPWFALGHITPFLHLSNKLAKKGHKISFLIPTKTQQKLKPFNLHPDLITFIPVTVPHVDGLPLGTETTYDVPDTLHALVMTAMDRTEKYVEDLLLGLKVDVVFFDLAHWMPSVAKRLGIKSILYCIISSATIGYVMSPSRQLQGREVTKTDMMVPPLGYPDSSIRLRAHEARAFADMRVMKFGGDTRFCDRIFISFSRCDAMGFKTCREIEGPYCDYLESQFGKPVWLSGPVIPELPTSPLEEKWAKWLGGFRAGSVIYCALGSEWNLKKNQFQELLLGLALTALLNKCQLVLLPYNGDQTIIARMMSQNHKVGVEVEKGEEDGLFTAKSVSRAVRDVMEEGSVVGKEVKDNHAKMREFLLNKDLESSYIYNFNKKLQDLLG